MGEPKNTIEINGKLYDARTGELVGQPSASKPIQKPANGAIMDGVVKKPKKAHPDRSEHTKVDQSAVHHKKTHSSKTLARTAVKKPHLAQTTEEKPKVGHQIDQRLRRAQHVAKSAQISRFGRKEGVFAKHQTNLPVQHRPAHSANRSAKPATSHTETKIEHFEKAVEDATSHLNKFTTKEKKRFLKSKKLNVMAGSLAVLLLVGFVGYQNSANIKMRIASTDAGFSAQMPGYKPAGFGLNNSIKSEPGKVTVTFKSRTDDRAFDITQSASNWSSESLGNELASAENKQTWQEQGKTVYTYGDSNAAWVDGGVLYKIEGNAELSSDQLRRIVNSF